VKIFIEEAGHYYFLKEIFFVAAISKQAYYQHWQKKVEKNIMEQHIINRVNQVRVNHKKMGARPLFYTLGIEGIGINKFEQLLANKGLNVQFKCKRIITTNGQHEEQDINHVKGLIIRDINKVIVGDITYFFADDLYYIFSLKDAYSKRLIGLYGSKRMTAESAVKCTEQAIKLRDEENLHGCIHHTDAGTQYKSILYRSTGKFFKWSIADNCLENGMAEQLNFIIKSHYLEDHKVKDEKSLNRFLKKVQFLINEERPVKNLGYLTPVAFEKSILQIPLELRKPFQFSAFENEKKGTLKEAKT
jgi:putative transposase